MNVPIDNLYRDQCKFNLKEERDPITDVHKIGAVHNCEQYGANLILFMKRDDLNNRIEETFEMTDSYGNIIAENELVQCISLSSVLSKCIFYMAPDNNRMGLLLAPGSYGLKFYTSSWAGR